MSNPQNNNSCNYGVIQEQGFVAGFGLGFKPVAENEMNPRNTASNSEDKNKPCENNK